MTGARQRHAALVGTLLGLNGCDPVFDVEGAFFPAWMLCLLAGIAATAALRPLILRTRIEPYLGPPALIYSALALLLSCAFWLTFFPT